LTPALGIIEARLEWPNGAMCVFFSGEEPESSRGPQCELCVIDEIARLRYQQQMFGMMMLGLRLASSSCRSVCGCTGAVTMKVVARGVLYGRGD
jgi:phage terminase large subunit-like protein